MANLFGKNHLREIAQKIKTEDIEQYLEIVESWRNDYHQGSLKTDKETSREQQYNHDFFLIILGYVEKPASPFSFEPKATTIAGQLPDAVISYTDKVSGVENIAAVVELKGAAIDLDRPQRREGNFSPVQQGFKYKTQYRSVPFVIISNFWEFRLYHDNLLDYEVWTLDDLMNPTDDYLLFKTWYVLLRSDNFTTPKGASKTEAILSDIRIDQENIGKKFYKIYKDARLELLRDIYAQNEQVRKNIDLGIEKAQKIIDRLIFAAFAEDRGLLPDDTLLRIIKVADNSSLGISLWDTLKSVFNAIDRGSEKLEIPEGYNGGLFKHDEILNNLRVSDTALRKVIELGAYNFAEDLSVNILGHIFEQSISDLEEIKNKVNESNDLEQLGQSRRKKDGIFYTPDYIVRYIVDNSLGTYLREHEENFKEEFGLKGDITDRTYEKREKQAYSKYQEFLQNVKIVDPACGSGAFLVYVFDYLLAENRRVGDILGNSLFSTDDYVRDILRNNIYGVDLNEESVEITKLSLWLKSAQKGKKLTTLDANIKCGNSLIDDPAVAGNKVFNWQKQFPEVFANGGFDIVVGNPPWVFARDGSFSEHEKDYYHKRYKLANYQLNTYLLFIDLGNGLLRDMGRLGFITPNTCLTIDSFQPFREFLLTRTNNLSVINIYGAVFKDASVDSCMILFGKGVGKTIDLAEMTDGVLNAVGQFSMAQFAKDKFIINISIMKSGAVVSLMEKIESNSRPLDNFAKPTTGIKSYQVGKGKPKQTENDKVNRVYHSRSKDNDTYVKYLEGRDVSRYKLDWSGEYISYGDWLAEPRKSVDFSQPRLLIRQIPSSLPYCINGVYTDDYLVNDINSMVVAEFAVNPLFLLAILNSKLTSFWFVSKFDKLQRGVFPQFKVKELARFPVPSATEANITRFADLAGAIQSKYTRLSSTASRFSELVISEHGAKVPTKWWRFDFTDFMKALKVKLSLVQKGELLQLFEKYHAECAALNTEIQKADHEIDQLVYKLYNLTPEEIALVEGVDHG